MGGQKNTGFVWTPTKRRGPIAAEFSTPGPASIALNSTFGTNAVVKGRAPAFTISGRHEAKPNSASPGPGQYNINGLSYKGKDEPHAPSMHIRPKDPKPFVTPAPGDYCPEKSKKVLDPSPKFSFGVKTENGGNLDVPGPGTYNEAVVDKYKTQKSPAFSMGQRTIIPSDSTRKPGPGAHCPEKCMQDGGPKWTISPRLNDIGKSDVPGPGTYEAGNPDLYQERQPAYTIRPKTELPRDKGPRPSPNAYYPEKYNQDEGPKWTLATRLQDPRPTNVPGPGSYEASNLNIVQEKQPVYTMRPKTELPCDKGPKPSPNAYYPEKYVADEGPKWTLAARLVDPKPLNVPAPGTYEAGDPDIYQERQPAYTMRPKTELPRDKGPKPSPNAYSPEKYVADEGPKWTIAARLVDPKSLNVPAPGTYEAGDPDIYQDRQPAYTMRPKTELPKDKGPKPSPNAYYPEKCMPDDAPKWTMSPKTEIPCDKTKKPSPNAYYPDDEAMSHRNPEFSFGIKHSQYLGQLRDQ